MAASLIFVAPGLCTYTWVHPGTHRSTCAYASQHYPLQKCHLGVNASLLAVHFYCPSGRHEDVCKALAAVHEVSGTTGNPQAQELSGITKYSGSSSASKKI